MQDLYMKVYRRRSGLLVAVCDKELAGETVKEGDIEVTISTHFYKGDLVGKEEVFTALKGASFGNFFGKKAVAVALESGMIDKSGVKKLGTIPHAQFVRMEI